MAKVKLLLSGSSKFQNYTAAVEAAADIVLASLESFGALTPDAAQKAEDALLPLKDAAMSLPTFTPLITSPNTSPLYSTILRPLMNCVVVSIIMLYFVVGIYTLQGL